MRCIQRENKIECPRSVREQMIPLAVRVENMYKENCPSRIPKGNYICAVQMYIVFIVNFTDNARYKETAPDYLCTGPDFKWVSPLGTGQTAAP